MYTKVLFIIMFVLIGVTFFVGKEVGENQGFTRVIKEVTIPYLLARDFDQVYFKTSYLNLPSTCETPEPQKSSPQYMELFRGFTLQEIFQAQRVKPEELAQAVAAGSIGREYYENLFASLRVNFRRN